MGSNLKQGSARHHLNSFNHHSKMFKHHHNMSKITKSVGHHMNKMKHHLGMMKAHHEKLKNVSPETADSVAPDVEDADDASKAVGTIENIM
jgi:hypothetical protein